MRDSAEDLYLAKAAYFDAEVHADWAAATYGPDEREKLDRLFAVTGPLDGLRVLEPGCGTGRLTEMLAAKVGPAGIVVAADISRRMVDAARRRLAGRENVDIRLGPVEEETGFGGYFDLVLCHQVFPHFADQPAALYKLARMLEPGGRLVISHFISSAQINDVHRKAGTAVAEDMMPPRETLQNWCGRCRLWIEAWKDDAEGYLLSTRLD